jgi:hypothetical protein
LVYMEPYRLSVINWCYHRTEKSVNPAGCLSSTGVATVQRQVSTLLAVNQLALPYKEKCDNMLTLPAGGGGKGGDLMTRTFDGRFFVKQLNGGDAASLLRDDFLRAYVARVATGSSLLCKVVAVFKHPKLGQFLAMVGVCTS